MQYRPRHRQLSSVLCFAEFFTYFVSCSLCAGVSVPAPRRYKELNHDMGIVPQRIDWVKSHLQQTSARRKLDFFHVSSALVRIQHSRQCLDRTEPTNFQRIKRLGSKHRIFFWASRDVLELVHLGTSWHSLVGLSGEGFALPRRIVEADLGRPLSEVYESFEEEPLASASVAQVHSAVRAPRWAIGIRMHQVKIMEVR